MKIKVEKDNIVKEVEDFLVPDYVTAGWRKVDNKKNNKNKPNEKDPLMK